MKHLNQAGDTIVEVLICIAIISMVLGGAFVTVNRSKLGVLDSQEHANALKLVESQVEQLRADAVAGGSGADIFAATTPLPFCMYQGSAVDASASLTKKDCQLSTGGSPTTAQPQFYLTVGRSGPDASGGYLFTVNASWNDVNGGQGSESIVYRLYK